MTRSKTAAALLLLALAACSGGDGGGDPTGNQAGSVSGAVTASGTGVANAQVSLGTAGTQTTDADGKYSFANVNAGNYTLTVSLPAGYGLGSESGSKSVSVAAGQSASVNFTVARTAPAETREVQMLAATFNPANVTVSVGSTVRWVNGVAFTHTVTPTNSALAGWGSFRGTNVTGLNSAVTHTFSAPGQYDYVCTLHAGMTGSVRVQ